LYLVRKKYGQYFVGPPVPTRTFVDMVSPSDMVAVNTLHYHGYW